MHHLQVVYMHLSCRQGLGMQPLLAQIDLVPHMQHSSLCLQESLAMSCE